MFDQSFLHPFQYRSPIALLATDFYQIGIRESESRIICENHVCAALDLSFEDLTSFFYTVPQQLRFYIEYKHWDLYWQLTGLRFKMNTLNKLHVKMM